MKLKLFERFKVWLARPVLRELEKQMTIIVDETYSRVIHPAGYDTFSLMCTIKGGIRRGKLNAKAALDVSALLEPPRPAKKIAVVRPLKKLDGGKRKV
ncbi:MAG: hypothetical protein E6R03_04090 [Hyphomicrobiaceae bacterium]|nr:MAG: hypothetical protein E6R03_04090 [Hyphomicrobiaceae bacterium]